MTLTPKQEWWTTTELAASGLPDVPDTRQGVDAMAERQHWRAHPHYARRRSGRGGGWEYCWRLLPARAQRRLLAEVAPAGGAGAERPERDTAWAWFERLPEAVQGKARAKLLVIQAVEALEPVLGRDQAIRQVAAAEGKGVRTIWGWLSLVEGVRPDDRLPYLADRHRVETAPRGARSEVAPDFFELIKSDFLRSSGPSFSSCYRHLHIDFDEALRDGLYQRICLRTGDAWTPAAEAGWRQEIIDFYGEGADEELFCIPALGSGAWLPAPLIEARMTAPGRVMRLELPADYLHRPALDQEALMAPFLEELGEVLAGIDLGPLYAFGFDFGRVADLSTVSLLAIEAGLKRREALALEMRNVPGD
ncbi:DNA-binding protein, partial [Gemmobacter caeni]